MATVTGYQNDWNPTTGLFGNKKYDSTTTLTIANGEKVKVYIKGGVFYADKSCTDKLGDNSSAAIKELNNRHGCGGASKTDQAEEAKPASEATRGYQVGNSSGAGSTSGAGGTGSTKSLQEQIEDKKKSITTDGYYVYNMTDSDGTEYKVKITKKGKKIEVESQPK